MLVRDRHHRYHLDGAIVPSVTQVLRGQLPRYDTPDAKRAMQRGTRVHAWIAAELRGAAERPALRPGDRPYLDAWDDWWRTHARPVLAVELLIAHPIGYAGQVDAVLQGPTGPEAWDWKTGDPADWHGPQLAAYVSALNGQYRGVTRHNLYLSPAGHWRPRAQKRPVDIIDWWRAFNEYTAVQTGAPDAETEVCPDTAD